MSVPKWFAGAGLAFCPLGPRSQQGSNLLPLVVNPSCRARPTSRTSEHLPIPVQRGHLRPRRWDPSGLARLARSCGARYVVLTTSHHAGFSMFHSKFSTFSIEYSPTVVT